MREHWSSRFGFVLAAAGSAIGLGTLWKFPYVTGENGGGLFVLCYLVFTLLIGIPLFIGELVLGRQAQRGAVGTFAELSGSGSSWKVVGWLGVFSSFLILSFYCVVAGWGLNYLLMSVNQVYDNLSMEQIQASFGLLYASPDMNLFWAFLFLLLTLGVVYQGVRKGIEFWSKVLTLALIGLLVCLTLYSLTLEGFAEAVAFLFKPTLKPTGVLEALGLSLFTLSLSQGVLLTYGSYLKPSEDVPKTALVIGTMVIVVAILSVLMIFPVIFTFNLEPQGGAGLVFKTLPFLFAQLPGSMLISTLFFALFTFTALTSAVALLEVVVANMIDLFQWSRKRSALIATASAFIVGIPSALAGSGDLFQKWLPIYGLDFFQTVDTLVSVWLLPIGGFLLALYIGWRLDYSIVRNAFLSGTTWGKLFRPWLFLVRWIVPLAILLVFLHKSGFLSST